MAFNVFFSEEALTIFENLEGQDTDFLIKKVETLATFPRVLNIKMVTKFSPHYSLRAGEYRILFEVDKKDIVVQKIY